MMIGISISTLTLIHVVLSLIGIGSGLVVMAGLLTRRRLDGWTVIFLITTAATSLTGFLFPFQKLLPSHKVGIVSLVVLAVAFLARYAFHLAGGWRKTYVVSAAIALYLNVLVAVVQAFEKAPALKKLAPTQSEPPFVVTQIIVMVAFFVLSIAASIKFRDKIA